jgi:putative ABC transport system permease protein
VVEEVPPGAALVSPGWGTGEGEGEEVLPVWRTLLPLSVADGSFATVAYSELEMPSPVLNGNTKLVSGRWPATAGECVATAWATGQASPPIGEWPLTIVGRLKDVFYPSADGFYCAPGTWETWRLSEAEQQASRFAVSAEFFLLGDPGVVERELVQVVDGGQYGACTVETREQLLAFSGVSAQKFLGEQAPFLALPFGVALVLAGRLARWSGVVSRALVRAGVPALPLRRTMAATALGGTVVATLVGGVGGAILAFAARPGLMLANSGAPLSDWRLPVADLLEIMLVCVIAAGLGLGVGDAVTSARLGQHDRVATPLSRTTQIVVAVAGAVVAVAALGAVLMSAGRLWWMVGGGLALVIGLAAVTPLLVGKLGTVLSRRPVSATTLAGRILVEDSRRWGVVTAMMTVVLGVVCSLFVMSASSLAGQVILESSPIPAGSVRIEVEAYGGAQLPPATLTRFESDLGLATSPVVLTELGVKLGNWGLIQAVTSLDDARRLLGDLSDSAVMVLQHGGAVVVGKTMNNETDMLAEPVDGTSGVSIPIISIRPDQAHRYTTGAGFALAPALPERLQQAEVVRVWNVYQGLTPAQDVKARSWGADTGLNAFQTQAYRPSTGFSLPQWLAISLLGFGLLFAPLLALVLRNDVRALRGLAATLRSIGLARRWTRPVFATLAGVTLGVATAVALTSALVTGALLNALYPSAFDLRGTPWWMLAGFLIGILAAAQLAAHSAMRGLTSRSHAITI